MVLDEDVICFQSPAVYLFLPKSINFILWLNGSDFVDKEVKNCPHPVPSRKCMGALTNPKPVTKPSFSLDICTISFALEVIPVQEFAPVFITETMPTVQYRDGSSP